MRKHKKVRDVSRFVCDNCSGIFAKQFSKQTSCSGCAFINARLDGVITVRDGGREYDAEPGGPLVPTKLVRR